VGAKATSKRVLTSAAGPGAVKVCLFCAGVFWFLIFAAGLLAQKTDIPEIAVVADKNEMRVGDRIKLEVFSLPKKGTEFIFPEKPEYTGEFSFISSDPIKPGFMREKREGRIYTYTTYSTGTHVIPPVKVLYSNEAREGWESIMSPQVPVEVLSLLDADAADIRDIRGIVTRAKRFWSITALALSALAVIFGAFLWARKRKRKAMEAASRVRPADEVAYEKLMELRAMRLPEKGMVKEYYVRLSEIVRYYLEGRFSFRAPEMTTEEFLESLRESPVLRSEHKHLLREFLSHCDMVKFAKYGPTPLEMLDSFSSAEKLVDQTRRREGDEEV